MAKRLNIAAILIVALFSFGISTSLFAQNGVVPTGGNVKNANGSLSFSFGQPADAILLSPNMTNEGLQQPYRPDSAIWNREVCQGLPFVEAPFNITALQTATPGLHVFRDTMLNVNRFGGDSIIVLKLTVNPAPELVVSTSSDPTCATYDDGSITLAGSAGTSPYEYRISTGNFASSASFTGLIAGDYKFYVKDNKGCIDSVEQTLTDPFAITFTPTASPATICNGTSTTLAAGTVTGGAGGYTYLWSATGTSHGLPATKTTASLSASPTATTTYTLRVTDANNCHIDNTVAVTVNSLPSLAATPDAPSCNGGNNGSITLVASGGSGSDYEFKLGTGSYDDGTGTNHENYTISDLTAATDYAVTVKDGNGCEYTLSDIVVTEPTAITFNIMDDTALCNGASIKIGISTIAGGTVAGDYTIAWTANTANDVANMATTNTDSVVITPTATTTYTATVTDDHSCSESHTVSVTVRANPTLTATPGNNPVLCNGGNTNVTLSATGGTGSYTYTMDDWANSQTTTTYSSLTAGNYTFRVRDAKGCTGFDNLSITEPAAIAFSPRASITSICNGGSTTLDTTAMPTGGTGAYTYNWTADNANAGLPGTTNVGEITVTPTATTVYTLTVSDANTCSHSETITINVGSNPSLAIAEQTNVNCFGATTGAATLVATGGSGDNYQFKFGTADYADGTGSHHDTIIYTSLSAATTTITVKDGDGCTSTQDLTITQPSAALAISAISATPSTICLGATSTLASTVEGGTSPYNYAWTTSNDPAAGLSSATATSPTATPTAYGSITYTLTITDDKGCTETDDITLTINNLDTIRFLDQEICGGETYTLHGFNRATTRRIIDQTVRDTNRASSVLTGCDSTTVLALAVKHVDSVDIAATINGGATYNQNGFNVTPARSNTTYIYTPTPTHTDPNVGSCDSITTLTLTVRATDSTTIDTFICSNIALPFNWRGKSFAAAGTQYSTLTGAQGQDSVLVLNLAIHSTTSYIYVRQACGFFTWTDGDGGTYSTTSATAATHTIPNGNAAQCDSTITLDLTIHSVDTTRFLSEEICGGDTYTDHGFSKATTRRIINQTITDTMRLHSVRSGALNCDSTVVLNLTVNHVDSINIPATVNGGANYNANGFDITPDRSTTTYIYTPTPTHNGTNVKTCDSITTLTLTVRATDSIFLDTAVCDNNYPATFEGLNFGAAGQQTKSLTNVSGGDSIVTVTVTTKATSSYTDVHTACGSYSWIDGNTYTSNNNAATHVIPNTVGCDSTITLDLTIHSVDTTRFLSEEICGGNTYSLHDFNVATTRRTINQTIVDTMRLHSVRSGVLNCDSTVVLNLTVNHVDSINIAATVKGGHNYNANGFNITPLRSNTTYIYTPTLTNSNDNVNGCDSITTLTLTVLKTDSTFFDTSICNDTPMPFVWHGESFNTAVTQYRTLDGSQGQDSVLALKLEIRNTSASDTSATACDNFVWYGNTYSTTSATAATHTFTNIAGCDSIVTLNLTIKHSTIGTDVQNPCDTLVWIDGNTYTTDNTTATHVIPNAVGCDSTITLNLALRHKTTSTDTHIECNTYTWIDGNTYTASNTTAKDTISNVAGCDSIITLNLTINYSNSGIDAQTRCDSLRWIDGNLYTANNYTATYLIAGGNIYGCDSTVTLNLTIANANFGTDTKTACDSYTWIDGNTYTASNTTAKDTISNVAGCDSIVTLNLTVNYSTTGIDTRISCDSLRWINGVLYTASNSSAKDTIINVAGCDSVVTLKLTVNYSNTGTDVQTVCDSLTWIDGITYNTSNTTAKYTLNGANAEGCDSVVTLNLTVNYSSHYIDAQTRCDSLRWIDGVLYTASNTTATDTLTNIDNCDSVIILNLTVNYSNTGIDNQTKCDTYTWIDGITYTASNTTAQDTLTNIYGCDSVVTLNLTVNYSTNGTDTQTQCDSLRWIDDSLYTASSSTTTHTLTGANAVGCDSTVSLILTINNSDNITLYDTICFNALPYTFGGQVFDAADIKVVSGTNIHGCDSNTTLNLTVHSTYSVPDNKAVCSTSLPYLWNNIYFFSGGSQTTTLHTIYGCDSTVNMTLTVSNPEHSKNSYETCFNYTWTIRDSVYTYRHIGLDTHIHIQPLPTGCTATDTLILTLYGDEGVVVNFTACDSQRWDRTGETYYRDTTAWHSFNSEHGCPSTDTLHLTIHINSSHADTLTGCDSLRWNRDLQLYTTDGTYTASYNDDNGCPSTDTLVLTIKPSSHNPYNVNTCNSFTWLVNGDYGTGNGNTYTTAGTYVSNYTNASGCTSSDTLHLRLRFSQSLSQTTHDCDSFQWVNNGNINKYYTSGTYYSAYMGINGCPSVDTLYLTLGHANAATDYHTVCDTLLWHDSVYRANTKGPKYVSTNASGCDSTTTLNLTIFYSTSATEVVTRCGSYNWHDSIYTRSTLDSIVKMNEGGCDSVLYLSLTITTGDSTDFVTTVCDSLEWNNRVFRQSVSGEEAHFVNQYGCDSVVTLNLTVRHSTSSVIRLQGSNQVSYNDVNYTATGTYYDRLTNLNNCDSFVTIQIIIIHNKPLPTIHAYKKKMVMVDHNPGDIDGQYIEYDAYRWYRNGVLIPSANLDQYALPNYADLTGEFYCEVPTDITQQYWVYSNTIAFSAASKTIADDEDNLRLTLYPNPTRSGNRVNVVVASSDDNIAPGSTLTVFDLQGRALFSTTVSSATVTFPADYPAGVYTVVYKTQGQPMASTKLIVK